MNLLLKGFDEALVSKAKMAAYGKELTLKEWVIEAINEKLAKKGSKAHISEVKTLTPEAVEKLDSEAKKRTGSSPILDVATVPHHDTKSCRVYGCGMCKVLGVKDTKRGLA